MPVTARLSRRFYEQFGDELTNELVDWFNSVDATYQANLRELNENNFARFDAKLEQRAVVIEAKLGAKIEGLEARIGGRIGALEETLEKRFALFETRILRWTVTLWTGTILAVVGSALTLFLAK